MASRPLTNVVFDDPIVVRVARHAGLRAGGVVQCRWADAGFPVAWPVWLDPSGFDWTCDRETKRTLPDPRECVTCAMWEPRPRPITFATR